MAFEVDPDLNQALMPLAWMIGRWQGNGHGSWPGMGDFEFGQQIDFATNRGPYLHYLSQTWTLDADGQPDEPLTMEGGFWRPAGIAKWRCWPIRRAGPRSGPALCGVRRSS